MLERDQGHGGFTGAMIKVLKPFLRRGPHILYPGSGHGQKAHFLCECGAKKVTCIEKEVHVLNASSVYNKSTIPCVVDYVQNVPEKLYDQADMVLLSWVQPYTFPCNRETFERLDKVDHLIYLGKNTDGTACADPILFSYLLTREVLHYVPDRVNTMIVYGPNKTPDRSPYPEEYAGLNREMGILLYAEIEKVESF